MTVSLKQLQSFIWVADLGSFGKAAERLHTSQPNISSRISTLEASLGVTLLHRDAGSVTLTPKGIELLAHAREIVSGVDQLLDAAQAQNAVEGVLKLGITEMVAHTWLRDFLRGFKDYYPHVVVELTVDLAVNLEYELQERALDLVVSNGPFSHPVTGELELGTYPLIWVASPELGFQARQTVTKSDLVDYAILTHAKNTRPYQELSAHFSSGAKRARLVPSTNLTVCTQMAVDGFGVAALLAPVVIEQIQKGQLVELNYEWQPKPLVFFARYDAERSSQVVARAVELVQQASQQFNAELT